jgi:hypothetical protein
MKLIKKILIVVLIAIGIGVLIALDISDRDIFYSRHTPEEELKENNAYLPIASKSWLRQVCGPLGGGW